MTLLTCVPAIIPLPPKCVITRQNASIHTFSRSGTFFSARNPSLYLKIIAFVIKPSRLALADLLLYEAIEYITSSCFSGDMEKKKMTLTSPLRNRVSEEIQTPEKPTELPRHFGKRSLSFSVSDVRRVASGLRMTRNRSANRSDLLRSDGEMQQKSQSCSDLGVMSSAATNTAKLSENYEMLAEFFNCLDSSIRLLRLKGALPTFSNISASIQHLAERRFTYKHLAQMKHILPEAISIKKVLLRDEATCCMKPELQVSLQPDAVEINLELKGESSYLALRKLFRARLVRFAREHPKDSEIPEETLPHPFGHTKSSISIKLDPSMPSGSLSVAPPVETLTKVSHFSPSFQRRFSARTPCSDKIITPLASSNDTATNVDSLVSSIPSPVKISSKPPIHKRSLLLSPSRRHFVSNLKQTEEDSKMLASAHSSITSEIISLESTPVKDVLSSARLMMTTTPELRTPKRSLQSTSDDTPQKPNVKRTARTKLFPTPRKNLKSDVAEIFYENSPVEDDVIGFLPESLLQDIREKEKTAMEEREANVAETRLRRKMIASLPKLFDVILLILQSGNRFVITKQELVHKIISCNCSVVDRNEAEAQLELMEELAPDWLLRKAATSGDIIYRVNKMSSSQEIRQRLADSLL